MVTTNAPLQLMPPLQSQSIILRHCACTSWRYYYSTLILIELSLMLILLLILLPLLITVFYTNGINITSNSIATTNSTIIINDSITEKKLPPSWCHWRTDDGSERSRKKKNTAPWWLEKQEKILGAKGGSWRSKRMETTVYQLNIRIFHKSLDLLISSILNNNNNNNNIN